MRIISRAYGRSTGTSGRRLTSSDSVKPTLRPAELSDHDAILAVVGEAFTASDHDGQEEVQIVLDTWRLDAVVPGLELVAVEGGSVIGHALGARGGPGSPGVVAVAPLCVSPNRQGQGVGSALMSDLIDRAEQQRWPAVVLLGEPGFYGRFGFQKAGPFGVVYETVGQDSPFFQIRPLSTYGRSVRGVFRYCWESDEP
jgi:putative acetyltransferase